MISAPHLRTGSTAGLVRMAISLPASVLLYRYILQFLGPEAFSVWSFVLILSVYVNFSDLGASQALTHYTAKLLAAGETDELNRYFSITVILMLFFAMVLSISVVALAGWFARMAKVPEPYRPVFVALLPLMGLILGGTMLTNVYTAVMNGSQRVDLGHSTALIAFLTNAVVSVLLLHAAYGLEALVFGSLAGFAVSHLAAFVLVQTSLGRAPYLVFSVSLRHCWDVLSYGSRMSVAALAALLIDPFIKVVLSHNVGFVAVGWYEVASRIASQLRSVFVQVVYPLFPASGASFENQSAEYERSVAYREYAGLLYLFAPPIALLAVSSLPWLIDWLLPGLPRIANVVAALTVIAWLPNILTLADYFLVAGSGRPQAAMNCALIQGVVVGVCTYVSTRFLGYYGVVLGIFAGTTAGAAYIHTVSKSLLRTAVFTSRKGLFVAALDLAGAAAVLAVAAAGLSDAAVALTAALALGGALVLYVVVYRASPFSIVQETYTCRQVRSLKP